jgi:hypothetical protein
MVAPVVASYSPTVFATESFKKMWLLPSNLGPPSEAVSWDAAREAVVRLEQNAVELKLRLLARHLEAAPAHTPARASAGGLSAEPGAAGPDPARM